MLLLHKIGLRSIARNKRRTGITLLAMIFGSVSLILFGGFIDYSFWGLRESTIHASLGHLQIYAEGFSEQKMANPLDLSIDPAMYKRIVEILEAEEKVVLHTPRLDVIGLISNGDNTLTFIGKGVNAEKESDLSSYFVELVAGYNFEQNDRAVAVLAQGLADRLNAEVGDYLTLVTSTVNGAFNAVDVEVKGVFTTGNKEFDSRSLLLPISDAQTLLHTKNVHKIVLLLENTELTETVARKLRDKFQQAHLDLEIKSWSDLAMFYHQVVKMYKGTFDFIKAIIAIIVILSISNTMAMTVFERTRQIGTIMALGNRRSRVLKLFLLEGLYLGIIGGTFGLIFGILASKFINGFGGVPIPPPPGSSKGYIIFINIVPQVMIYTFVTSTLSALVSALLPAIRASRLEIVDALRHV